jgi:predicted membrane protein (TIGR00267 family)
MHFALINMRPGRAPLKEDIIDIRGNVLHLELHSLRDGMDQLARFLKSIRTLNVGPSLRRFFVNTLFDSTFMLLGVIMGSAFSDEPNIEVVIGTMLTTSLALGISTGVSVYEAESLERSIRITQIEKAMIRNLDETVLTERDTTASLFISLANFATPLLACAVTISPFILALHGDLLLRTAAWIAMGLALSILFVAGVVLGRLGGRNPWLKGLRMLGFGVLAFAIGYLIESLI